jgi:SP family myo-inositol transporter-like MFS transporter 13
MAVNFFLYYFTILACIGGFLFGYDTGVISGALILISDEFHLTDTQKEVVVSMTVAGALVGSILCGSFSDAFGRKLVVLVSSVLFVLGSIILSAFAFGYEWLLVGRFVVGLGVGTASMIMPTYVCEASPAEIRGTMITYIEVSIAFGQFASACVDGAFSTMKDKNEGWRWMLGLAAVPAALQFLGFLSLPESPRWLLEMGR